MLKTVTKRNGDIVDLDPLKITNAISKANEETQEMTVYQVEDVSMSVSQSIESQNIHVEEIQDMVEEQLMLQGYTKTAKAYILYREKQAEGRKRNLFKPRTNLKPYEYPELEKYKEAIQHSYWLFSEFNYTSDVHDYKVNVEPHERTAIRNAMLAISQVEVSIKEFWSDLYKRLPKPEFANVGSTFAESEVRHSDAYSNLLELLGLNGEFEKIQDIPALNKRIKYLKRHTEFAASGDDRDYMVAVMIFSSIIEHISLFSQFLIIMSFNKEENKFKGMANAIKATSKEENLHGEFGIELVNTALKENPSWFDDEFRDIMYDTMFDAYHAEKEMLGWIFEDGELDFLSKYTIEEYIKNRMNNSLEAIGLSRIFEVDEKELEKTDWFDLETVSTAHNDFFDSKSVNYSKRQKAMTADDLF
mgnify:FL=1